MNDKVKQDNINKALWDACDNYAKEHGDSPELMQQLLAGMRRVKINSTEECMDA